MSGNQDTAAPEEGARIHHWHPQPAGDGESPTPAGEEPVENPETGVKGAPSTPRGGLGSWNVYFIFKLFLFWKQYIGFHALENLAFAAFLLAPLRSRPARLLRAVVAVPTGIALFYYDSWLPPVERLFSQMDQIAGFSLRYLAELVARFIDLRVVAVLVILWSTYLLASRYLRVGVLVMTTLVVLALQSPEPPGSPPASPGLDDLDAPVRILSGETFEPAARPAGTGGGLQQELDQALSTFHTREAERQVILPAADIPPFDLLFIHVCSISWDDLAWAGLEHHPLFSSFDVLLTNFNTAASYSGPAAVRLLRATCGQPSHKALYRDAPSQCYLFESLARAGFDPGFALNHDGHFDDFLTVVKERGHLRAPPMPIRNAPIQQRAFDGSPIYEDYSVLAQWLRQRQEEGTRPTATYYNTISLHDGNRLNGRGANLDSLENYRLRVRKLLDDIDRFLRTLEKSGRNVVVVLVPEHGAAVRGDHMQISGLREIPSPAITLGPVGIRVIGPGLKRDGAKVRVDAPTSYLAISHMVARLLEDDPFASGAYDPASLVEGLPETRFVAENEGTVVMRHRGAYYLRLEGEEWIPYPKGTP